MPKKKWKKPKLIVLVRSKPEEAILQGCKARGMGGPTTDQDYCNLMLIDRGCAGPCNSVFSS